jgi:hypothetical protein
LGDPPIGGRTQLDRWPLQGPRCVPRGSGGDQDFFGSLPGQASPTVSPEPDAFLTAQSDSWQVDDRAIDELWQQLVPALVESSGDKIKPSSLSKPSGPLGARLAVCWHYPTYTTKQRDFGSTMDPSNPCIRAQYERLGASRAVLTHDTYCIREHFQTFKQPGVTWESLYDEWPTMQDYCYDMTSQLNRESPIVLLVGRENYNIADLLTMDHLTESAENVNIILPNGRKIFGETPFLRVVQNRSTNQIVRLVFFSWHSHSFFFSPVEWYWAYHDFLWNAVAQISGLAIRKADYFTKIGFANRKADIRGEGGPMSRAANARRKERETGILAAREAVEKDFELLPSSSLRTRKPAAISGHCCNTFRGKALQPAWPWALTTVRPGYWVGRPGHPRVPLRRLRVS